MPTRKTRNTPLSSESVSSLSSQAHARTQTAEWCGQISCRRCRCSRCSRCNGCALTFGTSRMAENETTAGRRLDTGRQGRQSACCRLYGTCQTDDKLELCHAYSPQATGGHRPAVHSCVRAVRWRPRHAARAAQNRHAGRAPKPRPRAHARRQRIPRRPCAATPADAQIPLTSNHPT